jgi:hypothetical protein
MKRQFEIEEENQKEEEFQWLRIFNWETTIKIEEICRKDIEESILSV